MPESSTSEAERAVEKLKRYTSPGNYQIPVEMNKAGGMIICSEIHKLIISLCNKRNFLKSGRSQLLYLSITLGIKQIVVIIEAHHL